jgi:hypothetical protein
MKSIALQTVAFLAGILLLVAARAPEAAPHAPNAAPVTIAASR